MRASTWANARGAATAPVRRARLRATNVCARIGIDGWLVGMVLASWASVAAAQQPSPADFVRVEGTHFIAAGAPWHFLGANAAVTHGRVHRAHLEETLDAVRDDGLTVVRVWALGERASDAPDWARDYAFRFGEEGWIESSFEHLDRVLVAARARGLRVIVVLANRWTDYGGFAQYLRWAGERADDAAELSELEAGAFYSSERCRALYAEHVRRVVTRTNAQTGVAYADDPTILAYELANELSAAPRDRAALVRWVTDMAALVHGLDAHHLVSAGHIGYAQRAERDTWLAVERVAGIDYADAHAYPLQGGRVARLDALGAYVDDRVQLAHHVLHKPLVWGEFGFSTRARTIAGQPRAAWFEAFLARCHRDGVAGALVWNYAPFETEPREHALYPSGDGARGTRDLRRLLARTARQWRSDPPRERNARLGEAFGETPRARLDVELRRPPVRVRWRVLGPGRASLHLRPESFVRARFDAVGVWSEPPVPHVWAAGAGEVEYVVPAPPGGRAARLTVRARLSSELPGAGAGARPGDTSTVHVELGGVALGVLVAPVDDGRGAWRELVIDDPALLARALSRTEARLVFRVARGEVENGVCFYGDLPSEPGGIELVWESAQAPVPNRQQPVNDVTPR